MRHVLVAALAASLALASCATTGSASGPPTSAPTSAGEVVDHPEQVSPTHPYCMYIRQAGQLRQCQQIAFGKCTVWGERCKEPGWVVAPADAGAATPASSTE